MRSPDVVSSLIGTAALAGVVVGDVTLSKEIETKN